MQFRALFWVTCIKDLITNFFGNSEKTGYLRKKKALLHPPAMRIFKTPYLGDHVQQVTG